VNEYIVYKSYLIPTKKGSLPDIKYEYLADSIENPSYSLDLDDAYRFYDLAEVKKVAELLNMEVGRLDIKVTRV